MPALLAASAAAVCAMPGCPTLVEARRGKDVLYCSESHLTLALLDVEPMYGYQLRAEFEQRTGAF